MAESLELPAPKNVSDEVARVIGIFRELRGGETLDGKMTLKTPTGNLSTAEAIAVMVGGLSQAAFFNDGKLSADGIAPNLIGAIVKGPGPGQSGAWRNISRPCSRNARTMPATTSS